MEWCEPDPEYEAYRVRLIDKLDRILQGTEQRKMMLASADVESIVASQRIE